MRFLMITSPGQERLEKRIAALGGQVLGPLDYKSCTHVCLDSDFMEDLQDALRREGKEAVSHDWVIEHFNRSNLVLDDGEQAAFQGSANGDTDADGMCDLARSVRREHCCMDGDEDEEMIHRRHHALFLCKLDWSPRISLHDYAAGMQNRLQVTVAVRGSRDGQISVSTEPDVKFIVMKAHRLLRCLHEAGLSLAGNFSSKNFLIGDVLFSKDIVLGHLPRGALKKCNDPADEELDLVRFDEMIRRELFVESIVPHDLNVWLSLIAEKGFQELLQDHISMMEVYHSVFTFTSLCNDFEEMEHDDPDKHSVIISELSEYSDWKRRVNAREGNSYLQETLQYIDPATNKMECYEEDLRGLVRLVLNYFERAETWGTFALIVEQNFPNLLSDLQEKMFKAGYYVPRLVLLV